MSQTGLPESKVIGQLNDQQEGDFHTHRHEGDEACGDLVYLLLYRPRDEDGPLLLEAPAVDHSDEPPLLFRGEASRGFGGRGMRFVRYGCCAACTKFKSIDCIAAGV